MPQPVLDLSHLAAATGGDETLGNELLAIFLNQAPVWAAELARAADAAAFRLAAHSLKGAARTIGAMQVQQAAELAELETAAFSSPVHEGHARAVSAALGPALDAIRDVLKRA